jgi:hypothetical protein
MTAAPTVLRDVVVLGGGCYGTFYATQLARAKARGKATYRRVLVVDRDAACRAARELAPAPDRELVTSEWTAFCDEYLGAAAERTDATDAADYIVPSPHMPHLMFEWVVRRARTRWPHRHVAVTPVPGSPGTPYDRAAPDGTRYVSFADWVCPTHCVEPATCPATGGPRTWEMGDAVRALVERERAGGAPLAGPVLFVCRHHVFGVGTFGVAAVVAGDRTVAAAGEGGRAARVLVGTISSCHGALNVLEIGAAA